MTSKNGLYLQGRRRDVFAKVKREDITPQYLQTLLRYEPVTGHLTWIAPLSTHKTGQRAGSVSSKGYRTVCVHYRHLLEHRVCWAVHHGVWPGQIDHVNGIRSDNRLENMREATYAENLRNVGPSKKNVSGYKGVSFHSRSQKYRASITKDRKTHYLGVHNSAEEAAIAYNNAAIKYHGEFAWLTAPTSPAIDSLEVLHTYRPMMKLTKAQRRALEKYADFGERGAYYKHIGVQWRVMMQLKSAGLIAWKSGCEWITDAGRSALGDE